MSHLVQETSHSHKAHKCRSLGCAVPFLEQKEKETESKNGAKIRDLEFPHHGGGGREIE